MKRILALFALASLMALSVASGQEGENEETEFKLQVQRATEQPQELPNLIKENEKHEAEQKAAADKQPAPKADRSGGQATQTSVRPGVPVDLPVGVAKGSLTYDGSTADLKFASAFMDEQGQHKSLVVLVSDQQLPVEKWKSEFDMMMDHTKWSGLVLFVDNQGVYRTDIRSKGRQTSVSGLFDTIIDTSVAGDAMGTAKSSGSDQAIRIDVSFHARK